MKSANMSSVEYTGTKTWAANPNRRYFFIIATSGASTIEIGGGGGLIPLPEGSWWEPTVIPTSEIIVTSGAGTVVVTSDQRGA